MNSIILFDTDFDKHDKHLVTISDKRFEHIKQIMRCNKGDTIKVGILNEKLGTGTIKDISQTSVTLEISCETDPPGPLPLILLCSLPRPKTLAKVLQSGTAHGIKRFIFINSWRVEKGYWKNPILIEEKLKNHCISGLEQACDTILPSIEFKRLFKPFVEDEIPLLTKNTIPLVAHPTAQNQMPEGIKDKMITLAIGPEGGFIDYEIKLLEQQGFIPVTLGRRILRTEYALAAIVGKLFLPGI